MVENKVDRVLTLKERISFLEEDNKFKETMIKALRADVTWLANTIGENLPSSKEVSPVLQKGY